MQNLHTRLIGTMLVINSIVFMSWVTQSLNYDYPLLALGFLMANGAIALWNIFSVINYWTIKKPTRFAISQGTEPLIAVIIPTAGEPVEIVRKTMLSVLKQNYPPNRIMLILSDDANNPELAQLVKKLQRKGYINLHYHRPPPKGDPERIGEGKAGNLNSVWAELKDIDAIQFVETRDSDDLVGDPDFLRESIGQLVADDKVAFVQTAKDVNVDRKDRFGNREEFFYNSIMLGKYGANSVFPCGSGLVWRKEALNDIGGFPSWNLVEDFQSGAEALRRGWKGVYLPILGAVGQVAPEDLPNLFKQRGVWALDSIRFLFFGEKKGLSLRQRLHFMESGLFYLLSPFILFLAILPAIILLTNEYPLNTTSLEYVLYMVPYFITMQLFTLVRADRAALPYNVIVRSFQIYLGLSFLYINAAFKAITFGKNKKPNYKVTRKTHQFGIYIYKVLPQIIVTAFLVVALYGSYRNALLYGDSIDLVTSTWALFYIYLFSRIIFNSWHGLLPFSRGKENSVFVIDEKRLLKVG